MSNIQGPNVVTNGMVACWDVGNRASYPGAGSGLFIMLHCPMKMLHKTGMLFVKDLEYNYGFLS